MLAPGTTLGPYAIVALLGSGGMGEVYRARDPRLGREVAIKVLPAALAGDPERLRRFEIEAKAASALNHPNILTVHEFGTHNGVAYLVTELLEGASLAERLREGPLPQRKALDVVAQAATGVAAAHERGVIHRDLKPANIFVTRDGRVKVLDFGLAKLATASPDADDQTAATAALTNLGMVLGTAAYMAPEQVRGLPADARSDIFALGAVLYEALTGTRAFGRDSSADTMAAILKEDPPELDSAPGKRLAPGIERVLRHCLEKDPGERFQSARDLAFHLRALSDPSASSTVGAVPSSAAPASGRRRLWIVAAVAVAALGGLGLGRFFAPAKSFASYTAITFRPQLIFNARFAPDGSVVFSGAQNGPSPRLLVLRSDSPLPQPVGPPDTELLAVSPQGQLAVLASAHLENHRVFEGTLAEMPLSGGEPRVLLDNVQDADWNPAGNQLAIIRNQNGQSRIEYPIGHVLAQTAGFFSDLRFSPRGDRLGFFEHPVPGDDRGSVEAVDLNGKKTVLAADFDTLEGLSWSSDGRTLYFGGGHANESQSLIQAVDLAGKAHRAADSPEDLWPLDRDRQGRLLVAGNEDSTSLVAKASNWPEERDISYLEYSGRPVVARDGQGILFTDSGPHTGVGYALLWRRLDAPSAVQIGNGMAQDVSADGAWALSLLPSSPPQLVLYPTGAGDKRILATGSLVELRSARFFFAGNRLLLCGSVAGRPPRCFVEGLNGGEPRAVTPEGTLGGMPSPDGRRVLVQNANGGFAIYPVAGGAAQPIPGLLPTEEVAGWAGDGALLVQSGSVIPARVESLDLASGRRTLVRELAPTGSAGVLSIGRSSFSPDLKTYAYSYNSAPARLVVITGVR